MDDIVDGTRTIPMNELHTCVDLKCRLQAVHDSKYLVSSAMIENQLASCTFTKKAYEELYFPLL